jgi:hypothetical protein
MKNHIDENVREPPDNIFYHRGQQEMVLGHKDDPRFQAVRRLLSLLQFPALAEAQDNPIDRRQ